MHPPRFAASPGERPVASPLARLQSENGPSLANLRHRTCDLGQLECQLMRYLDGSRDRTAVLNELVEAVTRGEMELQRDGQPLQDVQVVRQLLGENLEPSLRQLARNALLMQEIASEEKVEEVASDLLSLEGMDSSTARLLASKGVKTQEDLAELALDDLVELTGMEAERAKALIMAARAPWFA